MFIIHAHTQKGLPTWGGMDIERGKERDTTAVLSLLLCLHFQMMLCFDFWISLLWSRGGTKVGNSLLCVWFK